MRSFNKARLIEIHDKGLDPTKPHTIGPDGGLGHRPKDEQHPHKKEKVHEKHEPEILETVVEPIAEPEEPVVPVVEKKTTKKKTTSKA